MYKPLQSIMYATLVALTPACAAATQVREEPAPVAETAPATNYQGLVAQEKQLLAARQQAEAALARKVLVDESVVCATIEGPLRLKEKDTQRLVEFVARGYGIERFFDDLKDPVQNRFLYEGVEMVLTTNGVVYEVGATEIVTATDPQNSILCGRANDPTVKKIGSIQDLENSVQDSEDDLDEHQRSLQKIMEDVDRLYRGL